MLCLFSRTRVAGSPPWDYELVTVLGPDNSSRYRSYGTGFKQDQKVAGYSQDIHALVTSVDMSCLVGQYCSSQHSQFPKMDDSFSLPVACIISSTVNASK